MIRHLLLFIFIIFSSALFGGDLASGKFTLSGEVRDKNDGETIVGANIYVQELQKGVSSNAFGFYSLTLPEGNYTIEYSFIGYQKIIKKIALTEDLKISVQLELSVIMGPEVEVVGERSDHTESTDIGRVELEVDAIKKLPAFMGEVDILKTIQFLPGIQSASEGNSGFYVRGGGPDQNLILLDNATVYNASHLFGFFSVFNADAIKNIEVIKGGMPAQYGGRVASVLDITLKEGNKKEYTFEGGIGLISSRFTAQGPIKKDTSSFIISGRRTYIDLLVQPFISDESNFSGSGYYFYDLNMKLSHRFSDKDQVYLSGYFGQDVFGFRSQTAGFETAIPWGNAIASLKWNHLFSDKFFMNTMASFSDYNFAFEATQEDFSFSLQSGIRDWGGKVMFNYYPSINHEITGGIDYVFHKFTPGTLTANSGETSFDLGDEEINFSHEGGVFIQDEFELGERWKFNAGLRYAYFAQVGPFTRFIPNPGNDNISSPLPDEIVEYGKGDVVQVYDGWEPRFNFRYKLNGRSSIKGGYTHNYQFIHLASLSPTSLPTDIWLPSSELIRPQFGRQGSIGYFTDLKEKQYEASVEAYYKTMENLVEYKDGVAPEDNVGTNVDNNLTFGDGTSYGLEFFLKKKTGRLNGWVGYTWSKTDRVFEAINDGRAFPAKFDRRHDLSVVLSYNLTEKWTLGAAFVYATGNAITLPESIFFVENNVLFNYGDRNSFRMAPYHRADISATYVPSPYKSVTDATTGEVVKELRKLQSSWSFSIYNLYNRMNPYFIYFGTDGGLASGNLSLQAYQVSLFPILPSVTWNFNF